MNVSKTCYTLFSNKKSIPAIRLHLNGRDIDRVAVTKYLGMYLDEHLNWKKHVEYILSKLVKLEGAFYYLASIIDQNHIKQLYYAYIFPYIRYGIEIFGVCDLTTMKKLQVKQNKLLKILCQKNRLYSTNELHEELNILKCVDVHKFFTSIFVYKQQKGTLPIVFQHYYTQNHNVCSRSTRQSNDIYVPRFRTLGGQKSLRYVGAKLWNTLNNNIKCETSLSSFKHSLKTMLISTYKT